MFIINTAKTEFLVTKNLIFFEFRLQLDSDQEQSFIYFLFNLSTN